MFQNINETNFPHIGFLVKRGAYLVGGGIRDLLLNRAPGDVDIAVEGDAASYAGELASKIGGRTIRMGRERTAVTFRVVKRGLTFDVTEIGAGGVKEDLAKRDFTINALAFDIFNRKPLDLFDGIGDLRNKRVRMVSDRVFRDDPVRLLRAFRIATVLGFDVEAETVRCIERDAEFIRESPGERVKPELFKILENGSSYSRVREMAESGLLFALFGELEPLRGCGQNEHHDFDVFEHTMRSFTHLEDILEKRCPVASDADFKVKRKNIPALKFSILMHDIGKPECKTFDPGVGVRFLGHEKKGGGMVSTICDRLKMSSADKKYVLQMVSGHLRPLTLFSGEMNETAGKRARTRFFIKFGCFTPDIILHCMADILGKSEEMRDRDLKFIDFAKRLWNDYCTGFRPAESLPPLINGYDLMSVFRLNPSPFFKDILGRIEESRLDGSISGRNQALAMAERIIKTNRQDLKFNTKACEETDEKKKKRSRKRT